ncbi:MAG TPA: hypothetical protein VF613_03210 [Longimicrobium sp.]
MTSLFRGTLWVLLLMAGGLLIPAPLRAQQRTLSVGVASPSAQWRPVVRVSGPLRERDLREALASGLPVRLHLRVELWRRDVLDQLEGTQEISLAVLRSALDEGYVVEDGRVQRTLPSLAAAEAALQVAFAPTLRPRKRGRFYYLATLDVETLSMSDLDELRRWLRGEARPAVAGEKPVGRAVERGVRRLFVKMLGLPARQWRARSPSFAV